MKFLLSLVDVALHLDRHLAAWATTMGGWLYALLFVIIFAETGLVVTPFLPGDSLLFAIGALCKVEGSPLSLGAVIPLLILAAILGDAANYAIGYRIGPKVFRSESSLLFNKKHLLRTQAFYERYGGKTIIFARFVPIVRTFAPFVAGVGQMRYRRFFAFNLIGAVLWVSFIVPIGAAFAEVEIVKKNFSLVVLMIIFISILPAVIEILRGLSAKKKASALVPAPEAAPASDQER